MISYEELKERPRQEGAPSRRRVANSGILGTKQRDFYQPGERPGFQLIRILKHLNLYSPRREILRTRQRSKKCENQ